MKMRFGILLIPMLVLSLSSCKSEKSKVAINLDSEFSFAENQFEILIANTRVIRENSLERAAPLISPRTLKNDSLVVDVAKEWTSGFFPGSLWYVYEYTKNEKWADEARKFMADIESQKYDSTTHDLGFKIYCSFGNAYRLTKDTTYRNVVITAAQTLAKRYYPNVKTIRSWNWNKEKWECPVIIDNMMNLEMIFWAAQETQDSTLFQIAVDHANTTIKNHFRQDYSCFHVVDYDTITGDVRTKVTHQGYSDESAWSRGQAWAIYGYTMCYRFTKDKQYLEQAKNCADFFFNNPNLPSDLIPYWDFNDPAIPNTPRDVSAAAVIASALYELAGYDSTNAGKYKSLADTMIENISNNYKAKPDEAKGFLLLHSTGNKPKNSEIDVPLVYADYYYLEALLRKKALE